MVSRSRFAWFIRSILAVTLSVALICIATVSAFAATLVQLSNDPYTNTTSQHKTEVEPDTYSFGSTIVSAFQVGRFTDGGSSNIGFATSTNSGGSWTNGFLPGITKIVNPANPYDRVSDPSVAFDASHNTWLIASLAITGTSVLGAAVIVNRSTDGGLTWSNPVTIHAASGSQNLDKDWIVCDDTASSPFHGHCYVEWDDNGNGNLVQMSTSTNGGTSWGTPQTTANSATVIGGQPLVQPNGTVIVPIENANETALLAFTSTNGGASWNSTITVASIRHHTDAGNIRSGSLPTAEIDGAGKVFVVWSDSRFESGGRANDLVMVASTNGTTWSAVSRIPADPRNSGVDHFIPGLAVDKGTSGSTAHLVVVFYYYPVSNCGSSCQLFVGSSSSTNGGASWTARASVTTTAINLLWLPNTTQGRMVGDYISTSFAGGSAFPVFANATVPDTNVDCSIATPTCHEFASTVAPGLLLAQSGAIAMTDSVVDTSPLIKGGGPAVTYR